jgi:DNA-binding MarR family transcriptional regulator
MRRAQAPADMNAIAFGTKRAFHGFLRVTRRALGSIGLTAARFDMMCALLRVDGYERHRHHEVRQSDLRRKLGVTAPVVSRMLRALEGLGLVTRSRIAHLDRRQRWVMLTTRGEALIHKARRWLLRGVQRFVCEAICFGKHRDPIQRLIHMDQLEGYLRALRSDCGDTATLYYPWGHPDD